MNRQDKRIRTLLSGNFSKQQPSSNFTTKVMDSIQIDSNRNYEPIISVKVWCVFAFSLFIAIAIALSSDTQEWGYLTHNYFDNVDFHFSIFPLFGMGAASVFILLLIDRFIRPEKAI